MTLEEQLELILGLQFQDSFYRGLTAEESARAQDYNFDHPGTSFSIWNTLPVVVIGAIIDYSLVEM